MLGGFFATSLHEIDDAILEGGPYERFETIDAKGLSPVAIAKLGVALGVGTYDELSRGIGSRPAPAERQSS